MGVRGFWTTKESEQKVEWAALKALQLDDTLAEGHVFWGVLRFNNFDWAGGEKEIKRALELDPNSALANEAYFSYLRASGEQVMAFNMRYGLMNLTQLLNPDGLPLLTSLRASMTRPSSCTGRG